MKIIKEGKIPEKEIQKYGLFYKGRCKNCNCEFEAQESEFYEEKREYNDIRFFNLYGGEDWTRETILCVNCPTCKEKIEIKVTNTEYGYKKALDKEVTWY